MMTLAGSIRKPDGTYYDGAFQLRLENAPFGASNISILGLPLTVWCDGVSNNSYSIGLLAGTYSVRIPGVTPFTIAAPDTGTYAIEDLAGDGYTYSFSAYPKFDTISAAQAVAITGDRVDIVTNGDGEYATYVADASYTGPTDGVSGFADQAGKLFRKAQ